MTTREQFLLDAWRELPTNWQDYILIFMAKLAEGNTGAEDAEPAA